MTLLATQSLWQAIYDKLDNDSILMAEISGIFDPVPEGQDLPYITIGEGSSYDWSAKDFSGQEHIIDVHIWSEQKGGGQIRALADKVSGLLVGQDLPLIGHQLIELKFIFFENFFDENGDVRHGILRFRANSIQNS
ncbi:hypothetical protein MNBD_ALPHA03-842 [hydrothermal vent metagenome]|uniref:DUF3168 domain-containing protein n=1 Tax=hydrothermal vent metagenome TaxID=652676 RepID=A0A3B1BBF9_9ZZZZ